MYSVNFSLGNFRGLTRPVITHIEGDDEDNLNAHFSPYEEDARRVLYEFPGQLTFTGSFLSDDSVFSPKLKAIIDNLIQLAETYRYLCVHAQFCELSPSQYLSRSDELASKYTLKRAELCARFDGEIRVNLNDQRAFDLLEKVSTICLKILRPQNRLPS